MAGPCDSPRLGVACGQDSERNQGCVRGQVLGLGGRLRWYQTVDRESKPRLTEQQGTRDRSTGGFQPEVSKWSVKRGREPGRWAWTKTGQAMSMHRWNRLTWGSRQPRVVAAGG